MKHKMSYREMSDILGRSVRSIRQYLFTTRYPRCENTVRNNLIKTLLLLRLPDPGCFRPNRAFYQAVKINQKRWWTLYFGEAQATIDEYKAVAKYFGISPAEAFEARQLDIFPEDDGSAAHSED